MSTLIVCGVAGEGGEYIVNQKKLNINKIFTYIILHTISHELKHNQRANDETKHGIQRVCGGGGGVSNEN